MTEATREDWKVVLVRGNWRTEAPTELLRGPITFVWPLFMPAAYVVMGLVRAGVLDGAGLLIVPGDWAPGDPVDIHAPIRAYQEATGA